MKLIATDLDGTLLNRKSIISKNNADAIRYAQSLGVKTAICTGRIYENAKSICHKAGLSGCYIIGNNGATLHDTHGNQILSFPISKNDIKEILTLLENRNYYYEVSSNHCVYSPFNGLKILKDELESFKALNLDSNMENFYESIKSNNNQPFFVHVNNSEELINKNDNFYDIFVLSFDEDKKTDAFKYFSENNRLSTFITGDYCFEMVNRSTSKGNTLERLSEILNISLKETIAFGDHFNDISMLRKAGISVAMGNAEAEIKAICKITTKTNDDDGVAYTIYSILNNPEYIYADA